MKVLKDLMAKNMELDKIVVQQRDEIMSMKKI